MGRELTVVVSLMLVWSVCHDGSTSPQATVPPLLRGVRSICALLDMTGSEVIKVAAVTAGSEVYEISKESGSMTLLQVWPRSLVFEVSTIND